MVDTSQTVKSLGQLTRIKGRVVAEEDVVLLGEFEGSIEAPRHKVTVGLTAHLTSTIRAREVVIHGTVKGSLTASERVVILQQAHVTGDIRTERIHIEDGARFEGSVSMGASEKALTAAAGVVAEGPSFLVMDA